MPHNRRSALTAALGDARQRDAADPLTVYRSKFHLPAPRSGREVVYFCGNSLGLMPIAAGAAVGTVLDDWRERAVRGHFEGGTPWLDYHEAARGPLARLCGADEHEVVAMNSLTVNLHLLMASFFRPTADRNAILIEAGAFPSDRYAVRSQLAWHGFGDDALLEWPADPDTGLLDLAALDALLERDGARIALALLPGVQYATGQLLPIADACRLLRRHNITIGLDLAHAIGNVPLTLSDDGVDFAVWCSYKYLNSGPGAVAGAYVHERHHTAALPRLEGWWGNRSDSRFLMRDRFDAAPGVDAWQLSNPPILGLAPVIASLELFDAVGMTKLRRKSLALTGLMRALINEHFADVLTVSTPADDNEHGCQLSLRSPSGSQHARLLFDALDAANVVGDWREPDILRFAPVPLYNSFGDVVTFCQRLEQVLTAEAA
ncbi:MAG: kynureninase [Pseudomonadota bacterium]